MPIAHTARFLQTFHTGQTAAQRTEEAGTESHTDHRDTDPAAVAFVRGAKFVQPTQTATYEATYQGITVTHGDGLITEPQAKFVVGIALTREGVTEPMMESLKVRLLQGFAKRAASDFISKYKDLPRKSQDAVKAEAIAPGAPIGATAAPVALPVRTDKSGKPLPQYYAVEIGGTVKFFRIKAGRKPGFYFIDAQASDDFHEIRSYSTKMEIIKAILDFGPDAAQEAYGQEIGRCGRCYRTLTDATSRARGIGPECWSKM